MDYETKSQAERDARVLGYVIGLVGFVGFSLAALFHGGELVLVGIGWFLIWR
jgi:hypothetical protein